MLSEIHFTAPIAVKIDILDEPVGTFWVGLFIMLPPIYPIEKFNDTGTQEKSANKGEQ